MAEFVIERFVLRTLVRGLLVLGVLALLAYPLDFVAWKAAGSRMGQVQVDRFTVAELKGGKEDYYPDGSAAVDCSRSLFPEAGAGACWWIARHREVIERY